jgi:hypothetical protein
MVIKGSLTDVRRAILDHRETLVKTKAGLQLPRMFGNLRETTEYEQLNADSVP